MSEDSDQIAGRIAEAAARVAAAEANLVAAQREWAGWMALRVDSDPVAAYEGYGT